MFELIWNEELGNPIKTPTFLFAIFFFRPTFQSILLLPAQAVGCTIKGENLERLSHLISLELDALKILQHICWLETSQELDADASPDCWKMLNSGRDLSIFPTAVPSS